MTGRIQSSPLTEAWDTSSFREACSVVPVGKVRRSEYLTSGRFPVVDQGQDYVAGYSDDERLAYRGALPVIAFGDHTRAFKFVNVPFVAGADGLKVLLPNRARFCPEFLFAALVQLPLQNYGYSRHLSVLRQASIPQPSLEEQRAIATVLTDADAFLTGVDALIAKKRAMTQGALHALLSGTVRLPGFSGIWRQVALGELGRWRGGMTPSMSNPHYWSGGAIPWISSSDISLGKIDAATRYLTDDAVNDTSLPVMPAGSVVVVTRSGVLRRTLPVARLTTQTAINQDIRALPPGPSHNPLFLEQSLIHHEADILSACMKPGTTVESIDTRWFGAFEIRLPDLPEQNAIAAVLEGLDAELVALRRWRHKAISVKKGIVQALMSCRIRLIDPRHSTFAP